MSEDKIKKTEVDLLSTAISRIISSEVLQSIMSNQLPLTNDLTDSNKIYCGKASILFVDMRESTVNATLILDHSDTEKVYH